MKPLNTGHSRSLKFCPLFAGVFRGREKNSFYQSITVRVHINTTQKVKKKKKMLS